MKVTLKYGNTTTTYENVKDVVIYPEGESNMKCFVSIEYLNGGGIATKYAVIYKKPDSIKVEN